MKHISLILKPSLITLVCLFLIGCNPTPPTSPTTEPSTLEAESEVGSEQMSENTFSGRMTDLLLKQQNISCTFDSIDEANNRSAGTVYIAGDAQQMRGDFTITNAEGTMESHIIHKNEYAYIWSSDLAQGIKTKISTSGETIPDTSDQSDFDYDQEFEYSCQPWSVDNSLFQEPANVDFVDMSAQLDQLIQQNGDLQEIKCNACSALEGSDKTACLQAMGC